MAVGDARTGDKTGGIAEVDGEGRGEGSGTESSKGRGNARKH